jgi:hypothetical protein
MPLKNSLAFILALLVILGLAACSRQAPAPTVVISENPSFLERLAASELRRYIYLRTGDIPEVVRRDSLSGVKSPFLIVSQSGRLLIRDWERGGKMGKIPAMKFPKLNPEDFWLRTVKKGSRNNLVIIGGDGAGILYGTYAFLEKLGIHFYLEGDVVPEERISFTVPELDEVGRPLFPTRGIQPFHDFPEGPDWWNLDNYKAILGQLPKLGMNFFGLHTYPEKAPNAEPTVWIGLSGDDDAVGKVSFSYPSSYQNSLRGNWGYEPKKTGDFHFGAAGLFDRDDFGNDVMEGMAPEPKTTENSNEVFNRAASVFRDAFTFARSLGIKISVGTETPLTVPDLVKKRLQAMGRNPDDPAAVKDLYKGMFERITKAYPIDYYWFWTFEGWTWSDASPSEIERVASDLSRALEAAEELNPPFRLATCGWVLGPPSRRTLFDEILPKSVIVSTINREVGKAPVDPAFSRIEGRSRWAIPWLEDDPSLTSPQLWVGRMRRDAADALRYGCDGLLGIHWRTRILSANTLALARAAWNQKPWNTLATNLGDEPGPITGQFAAFPGKTIAGTSEAAIYRDVRDRVFAYFIPVPNGSYNVTLKFCEGQIDKKAGRVFDILIQGKKVLEKLDIFERAGRFKALDLSFNNIAVTDGRLAIDFADRIHYPVIAGIVIKGKDFSKKINCGGPAVLDYEADWPETPRHLASLDFYEDWCANQFGQAAAKEIAALFSRIDGRHSVPVNWINGPGGVAPDPRPWNEVSKDYGFVDEMAAFKAKISGKGYLERFDYWLKNFEYMREIARFNCLWAEFNLAWEKAKAQKNEKTRVKLASETALEIRKQMVVSVKQIFARLLETVSNTGEMGTIANWEQHLLPGALEKPGEELKKILGTELPADARMSQTYEGPLRIIVPSLRTALEAGEPLRLKVMILSQRQPEQAVLRWREMGKGDYQEAPLERVDRGVYLVSLASSDKDLEYYLKVRADGQEVHYPATAPELSQTVVRIKK